MNDNRRLALLLCRLLRPSGNAENGEDEKESAHCSWLLAHDAIVLQVKLVHLTTPATIRSKAAAKGNNTKIIHRCFMMWLAMYLASAETSVRGSKESCSIPKSSISRISSLTLITNSVSFGAAQQDPWHKTSSRCSLDQRHTSQGLGSVALVLSIPIW